jgi:multiple sugar transport system ATP-binding protein
MAISKDERERHIKEAARLLEIEDLLDKRPGQLSGGQRQRVAVGRTIVREPRLFLMDEPLSNLDAKLRVQTRSEIRDLQQRLGTTTVYVTHDQEEAMSIADRLAIMRDGRIEQVGTPRKVYNEPVNEFIAGFVGDPGMNFIDNQKNGPLATVDWPEEAARAGLRPEHITISETSGGGSETHLFEGKVSIVEPLGHGYEVTIDTDSRTITATIDRLPRDVSGGDTLTFAFDVVDVYWFNEDGRVIS